MKCGVYAKEGVELNGGEGTNGLIEGSEKKCLVRELVWRRVMRYDARSWVVILTTRSLVEHRDPQHPG